LINENLIVRVITTKIGIMIIILIFSFTFLERMSFKVALIMRFSIKAKCINKFAEIKEDIFKYANNNVKNIKLTNRNRIYHIHCLLLIGTRG
jgi:hypothetical protein